jgi:dephospho-CoA kinase
MASPDFTFDDLPPKGRWVLLGVTGGIASGKTTVAHMLEEMGAPAIDFDLLSREVVEPGKPAWKELLASFGREVFNEDQTLNRKKLAAIVFQDAAKRKALEGFVHPRVREEFIRRVGECVARDPQAVIQAVIPLLIEGKMQSLFHKILLVYVPAAIQVKRLLDRDGISRDQARKILDAQLPIEEKKRFADYIIDNTGTLEETKRQVEAVWKSLREYQKEKGAEGKKPG